MDYNLRSYSIMPSLSERPRGTVVKIDCKINDRDWLGHVNLNL